ncbi:MAG TPA: hypothetical protein VN838_02350 [Bradyrhizobium sp.]|nr:hypothetical protein [Bradyrhizobium sp.]
MCKALMVAVASVAMLAFQTANAIEYNEPQAAQRFPGKGWFLQSGTDHGVEYKSYLEHKRLLVATDAIYYVGVERIETDERGKPGKISWEFRARCAVRPDLTGKVPIGIYTSSKDIGQTEQFTQVDPKAADAPDNASRGWYGLWWAACKGVAKSF